MRKVIILLLILVPSLLMAQQSEVLQLNDGWQFSHNNLWYDAEVPGSVQRDLIRHEVLSDQIGRAHV